MDAQVRKQVVDGIIQAIRAETDGHHFYLMAAQATLDPKGREVFRQLASEELDHLRFLEHQKESILKEGLVDANFSLGTASELVGPHPIFSDKLRERVADAHYEMSALSIALHLELSAKNYYTEQAEAHDVPDVRAFFERLAAWEGRHYQALLTQHDSLKEDYWAAGGFAPF
jgi:rubrerythrin